MKKQFLLIIAALMLSLGATAQMVLQFDTNISDGTTITLPLKEMSGTVTVDWGDGTATESFTTADNYNHTYANDGIYTVSITGSLTGFGNYLAGYENADKLTAVSSWGNLPLTSLAGAFYGAINLSTVPNSVPSTVTDMRGMFEKAIIFNQDISTWDVSNVTTMEKMFLDAIVFNQDIGAWDVSSVTNMSNMFRAANTSSVAFNQDISGWDVSNVTKMSAMFYGASYFNQDISLWDVSQVTHMGWMFCQASAFNQNIGSWDVSNVTNMQSMFENAIMFNQDISGWDVSQVTEMQSMFENAAVFDQDLGAWNVTKVYTFTNMFNGANLSVDNYNNLLIGWSGQTVRNNVNFHGGNSTYSPGDAAAARAVLTGTYNWTITDGGMISAPSITTAPLTNVTITTATAGGEITADGGSPITARGVVWGTSIEPTIADNIGITSDGVGTGTYSSLITGLVEGTTYYIRAYASNEALTGYGETIIYTPEKKPLSLSGSFTVNHKIYDATTDAIIDANNLVLDGIDDWISDVSIESLTLEFEYISAMNGNIVNITDVQITGADAGNYEVSLVGAPSSSANISPRELTIDGSFTVADKVYDGLTSASIVDNNLSLLNTIASDEVFLSNTFIMFDNKDVADNKTANIVAVELAGDARFNYTVSLIGAPNTTANITPKELTVGGTFTAADKVYDGTTTATITANNLTLITPVSGDVVSLTNVVAEFESEDAAEDVEVSITAAELGGVDSGNYTLSLAGLATSSANITAKELTIGGDFTVADKVYDGTTDATIAENNLTLVTSIAGDVVSLTNVVAEFESADAGVAVNVNITAAELDGVDKENYSLSLAGLPTSSANITAKELTVTADNKTVTYGDAAPALTYAISGFVSGEDETNISGVPTLSTTYIASTPVASSPVAITTAINTLAATNYSFAFVNGVITINKKELTIGGNFTVADKVYDGTTVAEITANNLTLITPVSGDDVSLTNVVAEFESEDAAEDVEVSITAAELDGADKGNYTLSLAGAPTTTATISAATSTFTVTFTVTSNSVPLEGATISINEQTLTTDVDGIATIELGNGVYPYSVTASDYVMYEDSITVDGAVVNEEVSLIQVGVNTNLLSNIELYPNPFQNTINISNASNVSCVIITNIIGKLFMAVNLNQSSNPVIETNLPSGIYLLTIIANDGSRVIRKMIRE